MSAHLYDIVAVGNAIVDILFQADDSFLARHGIAKNGMTLIEPERADELAALAPDAMVAAGGSAANTATGAASFGARAAFIGKIADDALGAQFTAAFRAGGVTFESPPRPGPPATARSIIIVTGDGARSMNTYLGASTLLEPDDIDRAAVAAGAVTFLEGYLFDRPAAKAAFVRAAEIARAAGRKTALTLSDSVCVDRHRESFRHLVAHHVDVLFANEAELLSLYQTPDLEAAVAAARTACPVAVVTRGPRGSLIAAGAETFEVAAADVPHVVDTTGAGDLYAAGFLVGYAQGRPLPQCGALASLAAGEVISHMGPRPEKSLKALAAAAGF